MPFVRVAIIDCPIPGPPWVPGPNGAGGVLGLGYSWGPQLCSKSLCDLRQAPIPLWTSLLEANFPEGSLTAGLSWAPGAL